MTNVTVSGNSTTFDGGGINNVGTITATNCTITNNSVTGGGGGGGGISNGGTFNVRNTIIAGNSSASSGPDVRGNIAFTSQGNNLIGKSDGSTGFTNGANGDQVGTTGAPLDARLSPLGNYGGKTLTHALLQAGTSPQSPAINAGTTTGAPAADQRGAPRVAPYDIGAYEINNAYVAQLPDAKIGTVYNQTITPESGAFVYTISSVNQPPTGTTLANGVPASFAAPVSSKSFETGRTTIAPAAPQAGRYSITGTPSTAGTYTFTITATNAGANTFSVNYSINVPAAPTAAAVSISGRALTSTGRGIRNVMIRLTDGSGNVRWAYTSAFGYYRFAEVNAGETVVITAKGKRYEFAQPSQVLNVNEDASDVNFVAY